MAKRDKNTITLGSGKAYMAVFDGKIPDVGTIRAEENRVGWIKGGAALTYTADTETVKDDLGMVSKTVVTEETAELKLGLITWDGMTLQKLIDRCQVTEKGGVRTVKIGGAGNAQGKRYVVCFAHEDKEKGDVVIMIVGNNTAGLTLTYATSDPSLVEPTFAAEPHDSNGTLIEYIEYPPAPPVQGVEQGAVA